MRAAPVVLQSSRRLQLTTLLLLVRQLRCALSFIANEAIVEEISFTMFATDPDKQRRVKLRNDGVETCFIHSVAPDQEQGQAQQQGGAPSWEQPWLHVALTDAKGRPAAHGLPAALRSGASWTLQLTASPKLFQGAHLPFRAAKRLAAQGSGGDGCSGALAVRAHVLLPVVGPRPVISPARVQLELRAGQRASRAVSVTNNGDRPARCRWLDSKAASEARPGERRDTEDRGRQGLRMGA